MTRLALAVFPGINWWLALLKSDDCEIELCENWVKQSSRSRYEISGANRRLQLAIPTSKHSRKRLVDVEIDYREPWMNLHWRSLTSTYNKSPFFDYYKDELHDLIFAQPKLLTDFSKESIEWLSRHLQLTEKVRYTEEYVRGVEADFRNEIPQEKTLEYNQVFEQQIGFLPNLSALDLLFNTGPEAGALLYSVSST